VVRRMSQARWAVAVFFGFYYLNGDNLSS